MNMHYEEYGKENEQVIVFLHGANYVHSFGKQYVLASKYHLYVPHIMGYGDEAKEIFETEKATDAMITFIEGLQKKVLLVGFSLGAQLAFHIVSKRPDLFTAAIIISPWLIKEEPFLSKVLKMNQKQLNSFKNRKMCRFIGLMNGLNKEQRHTFVEQMQLVRTETIENIVYNGITLENEPDFSNVEIPILALAGEKEQKEVVDSVSRMAELNPNCKAEIWPKAAHNIPPLFAKQLNARVEEYIKL